MMSRRALAAACLLVITSACSGRPTAPSDPTAELTAAPGTAVMSGKRLHLQVSLWRDFMPISPPDGKPLAGVVRVRTEDGSEPPRDIRADRIWVLNGPDIWSTTPGEERPRSETAPVYEVVIRDGPKWGPDVAVDVVVRLVDGSGRATLLSARNQNIGATF